MWHYEPSTLDAVAAGSFLALWVTIYLVTKVFPSLDRQTTRVIRWYLLPLAALLWFLRVRLELPSDSTLVRTVATLFGIALVWIVASALKAIFLLHPTSRSVRARTPRLLLDIFRFGFVIVGALLTIAGIWKKDLSPLLTTFGVGSIVLGLALQDTLGNVFAGLSLVFERPFEVGHWIQIGELVGKVQQINWRATRIVTKELDEVIIPNSALTKERIVNFSRPTRAHGERIFIGFSYDAPPNRVKEMLLGVAFSTKGVLVTPAPDIRTHNFAAYSVEYEVLIFISDYDDRNRIRSEFMSQVWYAAKRNGISIPYPISTIYKIETPPPVVPQFTSVDPTVIKGVPLFSQLSIEEAQDLAASAVTEHYGRGESIIREGDAGTSLFVIINGKCRVRVHSSSEKLVDVAVLSLGDVFGEMSLLAGEPRSATVEATEDVVVARIEKEAISRVVSRRPGLMNEFAHYVATRSAGIRAALDSIERGTTPSSAIPDENALLQRIRRFFGF